ncbi:MAG: ABC transporter substrate-binding protein [Deltaproteobacteria bacterium]|nr:ABC transporter substrate-binding protein [Deltaproteobacteria bacterium]
MIVCGIVAIVTGLVQQGRATPQRIISLKPNITEILFAIGAGDQVVGVTQWCNMPQEARTRPKVADYLRPNLEAVLALRPDLIITSRENALRRPIERLEQAGIALVMVDFSTLDKTLKAIGQIGRRTGHTAEAKALRQQLQETVRRYRGSMSYAPKPALLLVADKPLIAAGPRSLLGELLDIVGGSNVVTAAHPAYPRLGLEQLLATKPEVIIMSTGQAQAPHVPGGRAMTWRTVVVPVDLLRAGPRLVDGLAALHTALWEKP